MHDPTYETAYRALGAMAGKGRASILGRARRIDPIGATFFNTLSSCTHAFDDTHLATIAHPSGPAASAAFTAAELMRADGKAMLTAMLLGIEVPMPDRQHTGQAAGEDLDWILYDRIDRCLGGRCGGGQDSGPRRAA